MTMPFQQIPTGYVTSGAVGAYANFKAWLNALAAVVDGKADTSALGSAATRDTGTGATNVILGNDARLSDARTPVDGSVTAVKLGSVYVGKTANFTATASDNVIDCTANTFTVTLPSAATVAGREYVIRNSGTGTITITRTSSQTIDGVAGDVVLAGKGFIEVVSDGVGWKVLRGQVNDESVGRRVFTWDTVNARWQMTFGDTGWRDISSLLLNGWAFASAPPLLRRVNDQVTLSVAYRLTGVGASSDVVVTIPTGFVTDVAATGNFALAGILLADSNTGLPGKTSTSLIPAGWSLSLPSGTTRDQLVVPSRNLALAGAMDWSTAQSWPTTLPGTASGSIPTG